MSWTEAELRWARYLAPYDYEHCASCGDIYAVEGLLWECCENPVKDESYDPSPCGVVLGGVECVNPRPCDQHQIPAYVYADQFDGTSDG